MEDSLKQMPATETIPVAAYIESVRTTNSHRPDADGHEFTAWGTVLSRVPRHFGETPSPIQVDISGASGLAVNGQIRSISRGGLQVITSVRVPVQSAVLITIAGCCTVPAQVCYCVQKASVFQAGIVFSRLHKPEVAVGAVAMIRELEKPFSLTRGHVMDLGSGTISILCKTKLRPNCWVRIESNDWILFGQVREVVASSMLASCVRIHLDASLPAQLLMQALALPAPGEEIDGRV
jgi:hypothetical protein